MESGSVLLFAAMLVFMAPGARGSSHQVNITRTGCGVSKLCVATPPDCDPAGNGSCLFSSVMASAPQAPSGVNLSIQLSGTSMGYIAVGLTANATQGTTSLFICAKNVSSNGTFFLTMQRNNTNNELSAVETPVTGIHSVLSGDVIQCQFQITGVNASNTRSSADTTFTVLLGTGALTGYTPSTFNISLNSGPLDLSVPSSNVDPTTAPAGAGNTLQSHALLLLLLLVGVATVVTSSVCE